MIRADRWAVIYSRQTLENGRWIEDQKYQCFSWLLPALLYYINCQLDAGGQISRLIFKPSVKLFYKK